MAGCVRPARHWSPLGRFACSRADTSSHKAPTDERGCRRDIRSNGWIELCGAPRSQRRSGRRNRLSSFGADLQSLGPQFHSRPPCPVKSGPDVFADALVPVEPIAPGAAVSFPWDCYRCILLARSSSQTPALSNGYRFTKSVGKSRFAHPANPAVATLFVGRRPRAQRSRLHPIHRAP
jgi:hypothetical protein